MTRLDRALADIVGTPWKLGEELARLNETDPEFFPSVLKAVNSGERTPGLRYLVSWLLDTGVLVEILARRLDVNEGERLLRALLRIEPFVEVRLLRWLMKERDSDRLKSLGGSIEQVVMLIDRVSPGNRLLPLAVQLLRLDDQRIRSKSALMLAQRNGRAEWALRESDPRVRANAVEALWGKDSPRIRHLLREYARDSNNRVAGNALLALYRLHEAGAYEKIVGMSRDPREAHRATAAWMMGQSGDVRFLEALKELAKDPDERVRANAEASIVKVTPVEKGKLRRLELYVLQARTVGNRLRLWTAISGLEGAGVDVRVEAGPGRTLESQVRRLAAESVDLAFILPKRVYLPRDTAILLDAAVRQYYTSKRSADRGMVLRYGEGPALEEAAPGPLLGYHQGRGLSFDPVRAGRMSVRARAARYNEVQSSAFEPETANIAEAVNSALAAESRMQAAVNLVIVGGACGAPDSIQPAREPAQEAFVHAILTPGTTPAVRDYLAALVAASSGILLQAADWSEAPGLVAHLYQGLLSGYEILVSPEEDGNGEEQRASLTVSQDKALGTTIVILTRGSGEDWSCRNLVQTPPSASEPARPAGIAGMPAGGPPAGPRLSPAAK